MKRSCSLARGEGVAVYTIGAMPSVHTRWREAPGCVFGRARDRRSRPRGLLLRSPPTARRSRARSRRSRSASWRSGGELARERGATVPCRRDAIRRRSVRMPARTAGAARSVSARSLTRDGGTGRRTTCQPGIRRSRRFRALAPSSRSRREGSCSERAHALTPHVSARIATAAFASLGLPAKRNAKAIARIAVSGASARRPAPECRS